MTARPFLKWPGGKRRLLSSLSRYYPPQGSFKRYFEPFLGGGAVYFDLYARGVLAGTERHLSDSSPELINVFQVVRDHVGQLCELLRAHTAAHHKDAHTHYYEVRAAVPTGVVERAARTIYINKTCFNGIYRVNKKGEFNVSMGDYENPTICDSENLLACAEALSGVELCCEGYDSVLASRILKRSFVYFDPPYLPTSKTSNFTSYTSDKFDLKDHQSLAALCKELDKDGCLLLLTNSAVQEARDLYADFVVTGVEKRRNTISCVGEGRGRVGELIIFNQHLERTVREDQR